MRSGAGHGQKETLHLYHEGVSFIRLQRRRPMGRERPALMAGQSLSSAGLSLLSALIGALYQRYTFLFLPAAGTESKEAEDPRQVFTFLSSRHPFPFFYCTWRERIVMPREKEKETYHQSLSMALDSLSFPRFEGHFLS